MEVYSHTLSLPISLFAGLIVGPATCYKGTGTAALKIYSLWAFALNDVSTHHKSFHAPIIRK
jgi:hypothetical protein